MIHDLRNDHRRQSARLQQRLKGRRSQRRGGFRHRPIIPEPRFHGLIRMLARHHEPHIDARPQVHECAAQPGPLPIIQTRVARPLPACPTQSEPRVRIVHREITFLQRTGSRRQSRHETDPDIGRCAKYRDECRVRIGARSRHQSCLGPYLARPQCLEPHPQIKVTCPGQTGEKARVIRPTHRGSRRHHVIATRHGRQLAQHPSATNVFHPERRGGEHHAGTRRNWIRRRRLVRDPFDRQRVSHTFHQWRHRQHRDRLRPVQCHVQDFNRPRFPYDAVVRNRGAVLCRHPLGKPDLDHGQAGAGRP